MIRSGIIAIALGVGAILGGGCDRDDGDEVAASTPGQTAPIPADGDADVAAFVHRPEGAAQADVVARGRRMVGKYECNRCHEIATVAAATVDYDCAGCHRQVRDGTLPDTDAHQLEQWQQGVHSLLDVPVLADTDRFRRAWMVDFLQDTHDLRPNLPASMPRFEMPVRDAEAIAAFLVPSAEGDTPALGDAQRGRALMETKGCMSCHRFTGVPSIAALPPPIPLPGDTLARGQRLAPDLRFARDRLRPAALVAWLDDPARIKADAAMPDIAMSAQEVADVAAYVLTAELAPVETAPVPERLPVLGRAVRYDEVHDRVFGKICRHCHSGPDVVGGGGPGYSGGFGFDGRKLDLSKYEGIHAGSLGDDGERRSLFEPTDDGTPRLVAHLWARHAEAAGQPVDGVRGMPLGLPPLPLEDIQLVETWIAQGSRRG